MIKIGVLGAVGRMGRLIVEEVINCKDTLIGAAIDIPESNLIGKDIGEILGLGKTEVNLSSSLEENISLCDVIIDFTNSSARYASPAEAAWIQTSAERGNRSASRCPIPSDNRRCRRSIGMISGHT